MEHTRGQKGSQNFLQTALFCALFMRQAGGGRMYSDMIWPFRHLTSKKTRFQSTDDCDNLFNKIKKFNITNTNLIQQLAEAILTDVSKFYIGFNNLKGLDLGLFAYSFKNQNELNAIGSELTKQHI